MKKISSIDNQWFYKELSSICKPSLSFIRGDLIFLLPLLILILLTGLFSVKFMSIMLGVFISVRFLGEMMYWFLHQFHEKKYRPNDFGLKNLDNNAIYILYQTFAIVGVVAGIAIIVATIMFMK